MTVPFLLLQGLFAPATLTAGFDLSSLKGKPKAA
jgi:hypothetical protein